MDSFNPLSDDDIDAERAEWRAGVLRKLVAIGMDMARMLHDQAREAQAWDPGVVGPDLSLRFHRISRSIRMTLALDEKLSTQRHAKHRSSLQDTRPALIETRKALVRTSVAQLLERDHSDTDGLDRVRDHRDVTNEREDLTDQDFVDKPISGLIAMICEALGVVPDWDLWAEEPWAQNERRSRTPGSPYAHPIATWIEPHNDHHLREAPA